MKRKAYEEAGLSVTQQPSSRLMPSVEASLGPSNTHSSQVTVTAAEAMHLKTEKSAGLLLFFIFCLSLLHQELLLCPRPLGRGQ